MRYKENPIKKTFDGREVFTPRILPKINESTRDIFIATETGDRLDNLAFQFYGNPDMWWVIACANKIHGASLGLKDGTVLRIPVELPQNLY